MELILKQVFKIIFPEFCIGCNTYGEIVCQSCESEQVTLVDFPICAICDNLTIAGKTHKACKTKSTLDNFYTTFEYSGIVKKIIIFSKGYNKSYKTLDYLIWHKKNLEILKSIEHLDFLIPIPSAKYTNRIINPSLYISKAVSSILNNPPIVDCLVKPSIKKQKELNVHDRKNLKPDFMINSKFDESFIRNKRILLIDDVSTTGNTLVKCGKIFKKNFAAHVSAYSLSKDLRYNMN